LPSKAMAANEDLCTEFGVTAVCTGANVDSYTYFASAQKAVSNALWKTARRTT